MYNLLLSSMMFKSKEKYQMQSFEFIKSTKIYQIVSYHIEYDIIPMKIYIILKHEYKLKANQSIK